MAVPLSRFGGRARYALAVAMLGASYTPSVVAANRTQGVEALDGGPPTEWGGAPGKSSTSPFSAVDCRSDTRRSVRDIVLGDPNSLAEEQPQGLHVSVGETLCITGTEQAGGRLTELRLLRAREVRGVPATEPVVAVRFERGPQGVILKLATTSDWSLHYEAYIQLDRSRLVVRTHTHPVRPRGAVSYEVWRTDATELWLTELRFIERDKPAQASARPLRLRLPKGPADRRWGMDLWLTGGIAQGDFTALNQTLSQEGFGQLDRNYATLGIDVGGLWRRFRLGVFFRGTPYDLARTESIHPIHARALIVGPYLGYDLLQWQSLTTTLKAEYVATEVEFSQADVLPTFAQTKADYYRFARNTGGFGLTLAQEIDIPFFTNEGGQVVFGLRTQVGYVWQLREDQTWSYRNANGRKDGPRIDGGPSLEAGGWHVEVQVGIPLYVF